MIHAYDRDYLYYAQNNLGHMVDFAVNTCDFSVNEFFNMFLASNVCKQFEDGNPAYIAGKTGCELARLVILEVKEQELEPEDIMYMDKTPEYWLGWSLAHYMWEKNCKFSYVLRAVEPEKMLGMYRALHEADISKFVTQVDVILKEHYSQSAIARFRAYANLTQKNQQSALFKTLYLKLNRTILLGFYIFKKDITPTRFFVTTCIIQ